MTFASFVRRILRIPRRIVSELRARLLPLPVTFYLWMRNRDEQCPITTVYGPVVSLTSYGKRIDTVYLTIESIGRGTWKPSKIILWLDDKAAFDNPPATLRRLVHRGLEIRLCKNYGPHKKYYPYLESSPSPGVPPVIGDGDPLSPCGWFGNTFWGRPLITADDDILYPRDWLNNLIRSFLECPGAIHCYRAHVVSLYGTQIAPYATWKPCTSHLPSFRNFATGVSGVLYPVAFLLALKQAGAGFAQCCPKGDDIWLHVQALRAGIPVCQVAVKPVHFLMVPGSQKQALAQQNCNDGGNDRQIAATYTRADVEKLLHSIPYQKQENPF